MVENILHFLQLQSFYSGIIFLFALAGTWILRKQSAIWHLGLWSLVLFRLIVPPGLSASFSLGGLLEAAKTGILGHQSAGFRATENPVIRNFLSESVIQKPLETSPIITIFDQIEIWFCLWMMGLLAMSWIFLRRLDYYRRITRRATFVQASDLIALNDKWRSEFDIRRPVELLTSDAFLSPFTKGLRRPQIYLPARLLKEKDRDILESVIAHEMAHIRRWDELWLRWQNLLQIVYFFHPLVWFANKRLNQARERRCDEMVLATGRIAPTIYAASLLKVLNLKLIGQPNWQLNHGFAGNTDRYKARIQAITGGSIMKTTTPILSVTILILLAAFVLPLAPAPKAKSAASLFLSQSRSLPGPFLLMGVRPVQPVDFISPIKTGYVSAGFDSMAHPETGEKILHKGIDVAARRGVKVYAAAAGVVETAEDQDLEKGGYGKYVIIDHGNDVQSLYAHLSKLLVVPGSKVSKGELIGRVGNTGVSTGPHLHFEIRESGRQQNPEAKVSFDGLHKR